MFKKKTSNLCNLHPAPLSVSLGELMSPRLAPGVIYTYNTEDSSLIWGTRGHAYMLARPQKSDDVCGG